jgi:hypothetical protein
MMGDDMKTDDELSEFTKRGAEAWRDVPDPGAWVEWIRGNIDDAEFHRRGVVAQWRMIAALEAKAAWEADLADSRLREIVKLREELASIKGGDA